ncbi:UDP-Glycosyltransferase/glycogen phosphorylase [Fomitiporia mediterranea MF3/22]|uniref:UDP-Glycosyltransferase/glycogen phosphorylase n=1 Tax=Fomitiporia mediterranea (strain MF3/22) TaxID=694068 RepID=UPI0004409789|nr:UDP-Glycosyltransferase/glycogen phosphorylase [Fomitiporia mediterranea MF3/22]EJD00706.1 UDP-Glycosyltransferase/glycogen phosphorylase [Fomitiporia mediterranea MF3/22]
MTDFEQPARGHVVAFALPFWSHVKPLCALIARTVRLHCVAATFFTEASILDKVVDEFTRQFITENDKNMRELIRVVSLPALPAPFKFDPYVSAFIDAYKALCEGRPVQTSFGNGFVRAVRSPQLVVIDFFCYDALCGVRSISGSAVPIFTWQTGAVSALLFMFGPEEMGGSGDPAEKFSKICAEDREDQENEIMTIYRRLKGQLIDLPGIPPMYDHEFIPQMTALPAKPVNVPLMFQYAHRFLRESDGVINNSSRIYERDAINKVQEWFGTRPVLAVGPLSPPTTSIEIELEKSKSPITSDVENFLDCALNKYGPNSVVYISLGTVWWPAEPEKIWAIIDVLIEQEIPFLFSYAAPMARIPEFVSTKIRTSELGLEASWLPQQTIFHHKACGWFISHCGQNSIMEALSAGVPLICWPFDVDQPINAANISVVHEVGYELFEVRTGYGLRPLHRLGNRTPDGTIEAVRREVTEVFSKARGEDGHKKRKKAQWFSQKLAEGWEHGGLAWLDLNKLSSIFV